MTFLFKNGGKGKKLRKLGFILFWLVTNFLCDLQQAERREGGREERRKERKINVGLVFPESGRVCARVCVSVCTCVHTQTIMNKCVFMTFTSQRRKKETNNKNN